MCLDIVNMCLEMSRCVCISRQCPDMSTQLGMSMYLDMSRYSLDMSKHIFGMPIVL